MPLASKYLLYSASAGYEHTSSECEVHLINFQYPGSRPFFISNVYFACGVARDVDSSLSPSEVLELFSPAGVTFVYRCTKLVDGAREITDSVIATFAGRSRPPEIKACTLIYRVDSFIRRPSQCRNCWKFNHVEKSCKSGV